MTDQRQIFWRDPPAQLVWKRTMNPCGRSKHQGQRLVSVRLCSHQITHISMQTTHKHTCGMWEDAGFSDYRWEYSRPGSGSVTFPLPGSVNDPFLVQSCILQAITMRNQQVCVTNRKEREIKRDTAVYFYQKGCFNGAALYAKRNQEQLFILCLNSSDCLNYSSSSPDFSAVYFH